jgi:hypothetical protein
MMPEKPHFRAIPAFFNKCATRFFICFISFPPFSITFAAEIQSDVFGTGKIINPLI